MLAERDFEALTQVEDYTAWSGSRFVQIEQKQNKTTEIAMYLEKSDTNCSKREYSQETCP